MTTTDMNNCPDVRLGLPEDRTSILDLCFQLAKENAAFPVNPRKVEAVVDSALSRTGMFVLGVSGNIGEPAKGSICLNTMTHWYSDMPFISDIFNYVAPEHRRSTYARQQLQFAKLVADEFNMPVFVGTLTNKRTEAKRRLYEREFINVGGNFAYFPEPIKHLFDDWMS